MITYTYIGLYSMHRIQHFTWLDATWIASKRILSTNEYDREISHPQTAD